MSPLGDRSEIHDRHESPGSPSRVRDDSSAANSSHRRPSSVKQQSRRFRRSASEKNPGSRTGDDVSISRSPRRQKGTVRDKIRRSTADCPGGHDGRSRRIRRSRSADGMDLTTRSAPSRSSSSKRKDTSSHSRSSRVSRRSHSRDLQQVPQSPRRRSRVRERSSGEPSSPRRGSGSRHRQGQSSRKGIDSPSGRGSGSRSIGRTSHSSRSMGEGGSSRSTSGGTSSLRPSLSLEDTLEKKKLDMELGSRASSQEESCSKSAAGSVLQFDPTQMDNVYRVKQVTNEDSGFCHSQNGHSFDVSIASIQDPLSGVHAMQQPGHAKKPMFDLLGNDEDLFGGALQEDSTFNDEDDTQPYNIQQYGSPAKATAFDRTPFAKVPDMLLEISCDEESKSEPEYTGGGSSGPDKKSPYHSKLPASMDANSEHYDYVSYGSDYASETEGTKRRLKKLQQESMLDMPEGDSSKSTKQHEDEKKKSRNRSGKRYVRRTKSGESKSTESGPSNKRRPRKKKASKPIEPLEQDSPVKQRMPYTVAKFGSQPAPVPTLDTALEQAPLSAYELSACETSAAEEMTVASTLSRRRPKLMKNFGSSIGRYFSSKRNLGGGLTDTEDDGRSVGSRSFFRRSKHHQLLGDDEESSMSATDNPY